MGVLHPRKFKMEQKKHMKYKEPTKGKGLRNIFRKNGYKLYLVDEFRTSCRCSKCEEGECNKFAYITQYILY